MGSLFTTEKTPLICVPLTATRTEELMVQLEAVLKMEPDMIEWRADFFEQLHDTDAVIDLMRKLTAWTEIPFLFTIRSVKEGGEPIRLDEAEKVKLLQTICRETDIDAIDYEVENDAKFVATVRDAAEDNGVELFLSYHNFSETPSNESLIKIGENMVSSGADVAKLAVMPESRNDVNRLLSVTRQLDELLAVPIITMSMGELGVLSRVVGWAYGSRLTFAVGVESSAPGQVPVTKLRDAIEAVQAITEN